MNQELRFERVSDENFNDFVYLIEKLAEYEKSDPPDEQAKLRLREDGLSENPKYEAYLARIDNKVVGYAIFFMTYASYLALPTLYLEDIFVLEGFRNKGIGQRLFQFCVSQAKERECGRMEWCVFNWNKDAIRFYKKNGAIRLNKTYYRLDKAKIDSLG